jgi:hypothetical protein
MAANSKTWKASAILFCGTTQVEAVVYAIRERERERERESTCAVEWQLNRL